MSRQGLKASQRYILGCAAVLLFEVFFFRNVLVSDRLMGDNGDANFINLILEHWYRTFLGKESLLDFNMFYPVKGVLAYSDLLVGFVPIYLVLRFLSLDMYLAGKWTIILIHALGAYSCFYLLNKKFKVSTIYALCGVFIFSYSNMDNLSRHPQFYAIAFLPLFTLFVYQYFENLNGSVSRRRVMNALAAITCGAVIFYTAGYVGYFLAFYLLVYVVLAWFIAGGKASVKAKHVMGYVLGHKAEFAGYFIYMVAIMLPFLSLYLPISREFGSRQWWEVATYLPTMFDYLNLPSNNLLLGELSHLTEGVHSNGELQLGYPVVVLAFFVAAVVFLGKRYLRKKGPMDEGVCVLTMAAALAVVCLFMLKANNNHSLWYLVYRFIPGIGSMRAVNRFNHFLVFPMAIVVAYFLQSWLKHPKPLVMGGILILIAVQYIWRGGIFSVWLASDQQRFVESVPAPPEDCEVFYIYMDPDKTDNISFTRTHLKAMEIANRYGMKTINGYNSFYPKGWEDVNRIYDENYRAYVYRWVTEHQLENVYEYEMESGTWRKPERPTKFELLGIDTPSSDSIFTNGEMLIQPGGFTFGPYISLNPGDYRIEVLGLGAQGLSYTCTYGRGAETLRIEGALEEDGKVAIRFHIPEKIEDFELLIGNETDGLLTVTSATLYQE